ncbi:MAG: hypothetical protein LBH20_03300, partial [Treponema sp.]|nr:hypothetical protein [Treponema sp.]
MRNVPKLTILMALIGFVALSVTGCDNGTTTPPKHTHNWGEWTVTKAATCSAAGVQERVCTDDATHRETEAIPLDSDAHDYRYVEGSGTAPTCIADGEGDEVCSHNPSHTRSGVVIDKLGHEFETYESNHDADCEHDGTETAECVRFDVCGQTDTITEVDSALNHSLGTYVSNADATCTADGTETAKCVRFDICGHTDTKTEAGSALGHDYEWVETTAATYVEEGVETETCTRDGSHTGNTRPGDPQLLIKTAADWT